MLLNGHETSGIEMNFLSLSSGQVFNYITLIHYLILFFTFQISAFQCRKLIDDTMGNLSRKCYLFKVNDVYFKADFRSVASFGLEMLF